ncbi:hypothetical protein A2Z56_02450 [Candidatus Kaiserbacteria bacterium RIFCSPHIGHO2_12_45_16]|nr:MAG: hypothetical protein A2Z56_02450 [Candidatus Kaiserbacteria bacterium RIFCSPHIGHO2_12_45_16]
MSTTTPEEAKKVPIDPYKGDEEESKHAKEVVMQINQDLEKREGHTVVFNGMTYSDAYAYNVLKAINYAPPRQDGGARDISYGLVHEKIVGFCSFFLKNIYKRRVKCYDQSGNVVEGMGDIYNLSIEHSYRLEKFIRKIGLIYWEVFTQGAAPVFEEWEVRNVIERVAYDKEGNKVDLDGVDYTMEFFDNLTWQDGEMVQERRAVSRLMDGRCIIYGNPEINEVQDQPRITIEDVISRADAEAMYGSMSRWDGVPTDRTEMITAGAGVGEKFTLFSADRLADPSKHVMRHIVFDKEKNRFNLYLNGTMMLPRNTAFKYFYPRNNFPLSLVAAEKMFGSIYPRSVPMKTKFNADFLDWSLTKLAERFEQGIDPALLVKGKYTLTKDLFKAGQRTHGVSKDDYEKADPENRGLTQSEFGFVGLLKEILEGQTLNSTTGGEVSGDTATAVNAAQSNQIEKLGYLLDGIIGGMIDMAERRGETVETKYTTQVGETIVDGNTIPVYQNFTVSLGGTEHQVVFDDQVGTEAMAGEVEAAKKDELFEKSFKAKKNGKDIEFHMVNPKLIRQRKYSFDVELVPERRKDSYLQIIELKEEADFLLAVWADQVDKDVLKKEYLDITGRPANLFIPAELMPKPDPQQTGEMKPQGRPGATREAVKNNPGK